VAQSIKLFTQQEWIELLDLLAEAVLLILRQHSRGQQSLERRLGRIIHATHPIALEDFGLELEGRLNRVDHQA
jgi:hypothetical protein